MGGALTERLHLPVSMLVIIEQLFERRGWISLGLLRIAAWESVKSWAALREAYHFGVGQTGLLVQFLEVLNLRTCARKFVKLGEFAMRPQTLRVHPHLGISADDRKSGWRGSAPRLCALAVAGAAACAMPASRCAASQPRYRDIRTLYIQDILDLGSPVWGVRPRGDGDCDAGLTEPVQDLGDVAIEGYLVVIPAVQLHQNPTQHREEEGGDES